MKRNIKRPGTATGLRSRTTSTLSLASEAASKSSSPDARGFYKDGENYKRQIQRQISDARAKTALLAAAEHEEKITQALSESKRHENDIGDIFATFNVLNSLREMKAFVVPSPDDQTRVDSNLKNLESIANSLEVLKAPLMLTEFAPVLESSEICDVIRECDQFIANFKSQEIVSETNELGCQISEVNRLSCQISQQRKKLEGLRELEEMLRNYEDSLAITKLFAIQVSHNTTTL